MSYYCPLCSSSSLTNRYANFESLEIHMDLSHKFMEIKPNSTNANKLECKLGYFLDRKIKEIDSKLYSRERFNLPSVLVPKYGPKNGENSKLRMTLRDNEQLRIRCLGLEDNLEKFKFDYQLLVDEQIQLKRKFDNLEDFLRKTSIQQLQGRKNLEVFVTNLIDDNEELERKSIAESYQTTRKRTPSVTDSGYISTPVIGTPVTVPRSSVKSSKIPDIPKPRKKPQIERKQDLSVDFVWKSVFNYLDTVTLLRCARVGRSWRERALNSNYWHTVYIKDCRVKNKALKIMALWCSETTSVTFIGIKASQTEFSPRKTKLKGLLDSGLQRILKSAGNKLHFLKVAHCELTITDRCLWMAGCHNANLRHMIFLSDNFPVSAPVVWSLGSGCRHLETLAIPPESADYGKTSSLKCDDNTLKMTAKCWKKCLKRIAIGGPNLTGGGLIHFVRSCSNLEHLELHRLRNVSDSDFQTLAKENSMQNVKNISLVHTSVAADSLNAFYRTLPNLDILQLVISKNDFKFATDFDNFLVEIEKLYRRIPAISRVLRLTQEE